MTNIVFYDNISNAKELKLNKKVNFDCEWRNTQEAEGDPALAQWVLVGFGYKQFTGLFVYASPPCFGTLAGSQSNKNLI